MTDPGGALEKILLEYEQCHCSKVNKKVTITSMVIKELNEKAAPDKHNKQAFDCNQKEQCGVLTILGKERLFDWAGCTNPKLLAGSGPVD
jgi:rRNA-processing protein FCF1